MEAARQEQWLDLWSRLGLVGDAGPVWAELSRRYSEPGRHYHNLHHLGHCLEELAGCRTLAASADVLELAIWFHDGIYDTHAHDNEEQSALFAVQLLARAGLPAGSLEQVRALVMATRHQDPALAGDLALMVDIDLAILGQPAERYDRFEQAIRAEYAWVGEAEFAAGRTAVLRRFRERPRIYQTEHFRRCYEILARANLDRAIQLLAPAER